MLGNSAAFGRGVTDQEQTLTHRLEQLLQERVKRQQNNPGSYRPDVFPFFPPSRETLIDKPAKIPLILIHLTDTDDCILFPSSIIERHQQSHPYKKGVTHFDLQ